MAFKKGCIYTEKMLYSLIKPTLKPRLYEEGLDRTVKLSSWHFIDLKWLLDRTKIKIPGYVPAIW